MISESLFKVEDKVWAYGRRWTIVDAIRPNSFQDFLVLSRRTGQVGSKKEAQVEMTLVDPHNQKIYPDTIDVIMAIKDQDELQAKVKDIDKGLERIWLNMFNRDWVC